MYFNKEEEKITTPFPGKVWYIRETGSTMDLVRKMIETGEASQGVLIRAGHQTSGRGRTKGRKWDSPKGENLMFSIALEKKSLTVPFSAFPLVAGPFGFPLPWRVSG